MEFRLHAQQLLPLALQHPMNRNSCPFCYDFGDIFRSHCFGDDRILDLRLSGGEFVDLLLCVGHSAIADFGHLSVVACPFRIMGLDLIVLHLLSLVLEFRKNTLLLIPTRVKGLPVLAEGFELIFDLVHLHGHSLAADGLSFDLQLTDAAIQFRYRFRHRVHLKSEL